MPLPDPTQPADFQGGAPDADQAIRHEGYVGPPRHYQGLLPGKMRPYGVTCAGCGYQWMGYIEDGCAQCGAGKDGSQGKPEPARDVVCRACKGNKSVVVRCRNCNGSGDDPQENTVPCLDCGGAGTLTIDCRRCRETPGFDPEPQVIEQRIQTRVEQVPRDPLHDQWVRDHEMTGMAKIMTEKALPTLEDEEKWAKVTQRPRYFLVEVPTDGGAHTMIEIADSPKVRQIITNAKGSR